MVEEEEEDEEDEDVEDVADGAAVILPATISSASKIALYLCSSAPPH